MPASPGCEFLLAGLEDSTCPTCCHSEAAKRPKNLVPDHGVYPAPDERSFAWLRMTMSNPD